jgi:hypothetical protein
MVLAGYSSELNYTLRIGKSIDCSVNRATRFGARSSDPPFSRDIGAVLDTAGPDDSIEDDPCSSVIGT